MSWSRSDAGLATRSQSVVTAARHTAERTRLRSGQWLAFERQVWLVAQAPALKRGATLTRCRLAAEERVTRRHPVARAAVAVSVSCGGAAAFAGRAPAAAAARYRSTPARQMLHQALEHFWPRWAISQGCTRLLRRDPRIDASAVPRSAIEQTRRRAAGCVFGPALLRRERRARETADRSADRLGTHARALLDAALESTLRLNSLGQRAAAATRPRRSVGRRPTGGHRLQDGQTEDFRRARRAADAAAAAGLCDGARASAGRGDGAVPGPRGR